MKRNYQSIFHEIPKEWHFIVALFTTCVVAVFFFVYDIPRRAINDVMFAIRPSAQRAYEYGDIHFRAFNSRQYDIGRAEHWYKKSLALDPRLPYVHHQLARVAFLRGDFHSAMWHINKELDLNASPSPSSYYIRGLIEGYMGEYTQSAKDYEIYLKSDPNNWAAINDLAWVLLKSEKFQKAADAIERGLKYFPENPWLLNSYATALFELGRYEEALKAVKKAQAAVVDVTEYEWLVAYPGNDPKIAGQGLDAFRGAVANNMHTIEMKVESGTVQ